ncbi:MAG: rhomboid family intramembrane serine protease [Pseudomonadota bacterium]
MNDDLESPFNALPSVVVALAVVIGGVELMFVLATAGLLGGDGGVGWRIAALRDFAVLDDVWHWMVANNTWPWSELRRFMTYPFLHTASLEAVFVIVFILAMGKVVGEVFHPLAFLAIFWASSSVGALSFVVFLNEPFALAGGFPGVYGLIGAFTFLLWADLGVRGGNKMRAFALVATLLAIQLLFSLVSGNFGGVVSELGGFVAGFFLSFLVSPGGWQRVLAKLRDR